MVGEMSARAAGGVHVGESRQAWISMREDAPCSCGATASQCPVGGTVRSRLVEGGVDLDRALRLRRSVDIIARAPGSAALGWIERRHGSLA
jgi:hypothetical protein